MWLLLLRNSSLIGYGLAALACFSAGWWVESNIAESRQAKALATQESLLIGKCKDLQATTKGANDALQSQYDIIRRKLSRLQSTSSVNLSASSNADLSGVRGEYARFPDLDSYKARCEEIRQTFFNCRDFLIQERK